MSLLVARASLRQVSLRQGARFAHTTEYKVSNRVTFFVAVVLWSRCRVERAGLSRDLF